MKSICFFGSYDPNYPRNKILIDGLQKNSITVYHCRSLHGSLFRRYPQLIRSYLSLYNKVDIIYVAFVGHLDMPLAWLLGRLTGKRVVFDMFYSMYDTYVFDRQSALPGSLKAATYFFIDKLAATLADLIITDTKTHGEYFIKTFRLNRTKFRRIFVGGDETIFKSVKRRKTKKNIIEFHGMFTRLHGAEYYVQAAKLLEKEKNIAFILIGSTANYPLPIELFNKLKPKNMKYYPKMDVKKLAHVVAQSDISIGHIGRTEKARSVITNKTFHALACGVVALVGDCRANRELLTNHQNAVFVSMGDPQDLADKIKLLANNPQLRHRIAQAGHRLSKSTLTNQKLGAQLVQILRSV